MMKNKLRIFRIVVAAVVLCAFILLFLDPGGVLHKILAPLAKLQFWPAVLAMNIGIVVLWIAVTAVFGRWYCSCLCPLGIVQDGVNAIYKTTSKKRRYRFSYKKPKRWMKYSVLAAFIVLACLSNGALAYLLEPYSIFGRMMGSFKGMLPVAAIISAGTILLIVILTIIGGRTWCTAVCPVGTILGILSRRSLFRPVFDESKCIACSLCEKACKSSCIDSKTHTVDTSRCVMCMDCLDNCSHNAIEYRFSLALPGRSAASKQDGKPSVAPEPAADKKSADDAGESRRRFLAAAAAVTASAMTGSVESKAKTVMAAMEKKTVPERKVPVVPAGAKSLKHFSDHCVACHLCVSACPNGVLKPSSDMQYFMLPLMNFEEGFCRPECNSCSTVCPAGAIVKVTPEEKTAISIGHAVYNQENCIVITDSVSCGNCARHCPSGAISMVLTENGRVPHVDAQRCTGCGRCEYVCPSRPVSAIYVEGNQVHRDI